MQRSILNPTTEDEILTDLFLISCANKTIGTKMNIESISVRSHESLIILPMELLTEIQSYLCTATLVSMKQMNRTWKESCTAAIDNKLEEVWDGITTKGRKKIKFQTNNELQNAIKKYKRYHLDDAEEFSTTYGFPMNKWDVSKLSDLSWIFSNQKTFNEDISSWDVSNATNMCCMFRNTTNFNQNLSSWNVSNVSNMYGMFSGATNFNHDLSSWNVSNVTNMSFMFSDATKFNQDLSSWNVSIVTNIKHIF